MTMLGRETPELDASLLFSDLELMVLEDFAEFENLKQPTTLGAAMLAVAIMGRYLNRKNDRPPAYKLIWEGIAELPTAAYCYKVFDRSRKKKRKSRIVAEIRSNPP